VLLPPIQVHIPLAWTLLLTVKFAADDAPPPGAGFATTTGKVPTVARSAELSKIVSWFTLINVGA
jgi:hypothetical protein